MISIGIPASASALTTSRSFGFESASRPSDSNKEIPKIIEIFASSAGWIWKPPGSEIQAREPFTVLPTPGIATAIKPSTPSTHKIGV